MRAAALAAAAALAGCTVAKLTDDQVFQCDPARVHEGDGGETLFDDCGDGYACYSAVASVGFAFCVPKCGGGCPAGYVCSGEGGCLKVCDPTQGDSGCPSPLRCISTQLDAQNDANEHGVCLPVHGTCNIDQDCTSTVLDHCLAPNVFVPPGTAVGASVRSYCLQGGCKANQTACEPGSSCLLDRLPPSIPAADLCVPDCSPRGECPPDSICMAKSFPASDARICVPGFFGFRCEDDLACYTIGASCRSVLDPAAMLDLRACANGCASDADCAVIPPSNNQSPNALSIFSCRYGACTALAELQNSLFCTTAGGSCGGGTGVCSNTPLPPGSIGPPQTCGGVGTTSSPPPNCNPPQHGGVTCADDSECAALEGAIGLPLVCVSRDEGFGLAFRMTGQASVIPLAFFGDGGVGVEERRCEVGTPGMPCHADHCLPGLHCMPWNQLDGGICSEGCATDQDCTTEAPDRLNLGPGFRCDPTQSVCVRKISADEQPQPLTPESCLSGVAVDAGVYPIPDGGVIPLYRCVSTPGTVCGSDEQCQSGACLRDLGCEPTGRCR